MTSNETESRRSVLKKVGGAVLAIPTAGTVVAGDPDGNAESRRDDERDNESREILYAGDGVRVIKLSEHEYTIEGDYTQEEYRELMNEYVWSDDDEATIQGHSDSGSASSSECVDDRQWMGLIVSSQSWAKAEDKELTFEGECSATSYLANTHEPDCYAYPEEVDEINISSSLRGWFREKTIDVGVPSGYTVTWGAEFTAATLEGSRTDTSSYSLHHYKDAVTMWAEDCWYEADQDDTVQFELDNTYVLGNRINLDVGHCWW